MSRPWQTWVLFALCLAIVLGAMGWVSATAARLERSEGEARRWAAQQENVRLALWRMDSAMAPLVAQESARPFFAYSAFYAVNPVFPSSRIRGVTLFPDGQWHWDGVLGPSPLLIAQPPQVLLYFQFGPDGNLTSPQVPAAGYREMATPRYTTAERIEAAAARLAELGKTLKREVLLAELPLQEVAPQLVQEQPAPNSVSYAAALAQASRQPAAEPPSKQPETNRPLAPNAAQPPARTPFDQQAQQFDQQALFPQTQKKVQAQIERNETEYQARLGQNFHNVNGDPLPSQVAGNRAVTPENPALPPRAKPEQPVPDRQAQSPAQPATLAAQSLQAQKDLTHEEYQARVSQNFMNVDNGAPNVAGWNAREMQEGVLKPLWLGSDLILARRVRVEGREYIQGCLLDWPGIRASLLAEAGSLLPQADLAPVTIPSADEVGYMMASLPVRLSAGPVPLEAADGLSPVWLSLGIAWACVLAAAAGGAVVLTRALSLSERRGAFVSAVTHELRTPLTTFKMYAEMLAEDMVPDEAKKRQYLQTLRAESVRLGHLVENVLAYARLERGRGAAAAETATLEDLIARQRDRLAARAEQAGMQLVVEPGEHWQAVVRVDTSSVEQILFNLVDNACKYAGRAGDPFGVAQGRPEHGRTGDRRIHVAAGRSDGPFGFSQGRPEHGRKGGFATLTVRDHGPGISERDGRRLFHAFRKSARDAANSAPGIGLGLALSRRLARRMGGGLRLDSNPAETGACFTLLLPQG